VLPYADEIRERARIVRQHNQDALRHCIEVVAWETFDYPHLRRYIIPLFWLCKDVEPHWIAEAFSMSVQDVCTLVEGNPIISFNCLDCGVELRPRHRDHLLLMSNSLKAICEDIAADNDQVTNLLCQTCVDDRATDKENQRLLDEARQQALLNEYRRKPYGERRQSQEWSVLKQRIHRRDGYRCRLCGRNDLPLHLHHCSYNNYAQEKLADLITLCEECHGGFHSLFDVS
jgi:5-methylcytosine-specific restriction endonuclease McrA